MTTLLLGLAAVPLVLVQTAAGKRYAVLVGIYEDSREKLARLVYADADVTDPAGVLKRARYEVTLPTGSAPGEVECCSTIRSALSLEIFDLCFPPSKIESAVRLKSA